jgi:hypothetical protein
MWRLGGISEIPLLTPSGIKREWYVFERQIFMVPIILISKKFVKDAAIQVIMYIISRNVDTL